MSLCENKGSEKCDERVKDLELSKKTKPGKPIPEWSVGEELKKIDEICRGCKHSAFIIESRQCPVCESLNLSTSKITSVCSGPVKPSQCVYFYKCENCQRNLRSYSELT